ncbi:hypothetical protein D1007_13834 [Hordeum vulgare]|nr:hypothetical protein D1007_13834 [Hordeum vulgare]
MNELEDSRTKIMPSKTRGVKELPIRSILDSPSILNQLATSPPTIQYDMSQVIDTSSIIEDTYDDATTMLDETKIVPPGDFLDAHIARSKDLENETTKDTESPITPSTLARSKMMDVHDGYVMGREIARDSLRATIDITLRNYWLSLRKKSLNEIMKHDTKFATSPSFIDDKDFEFLVDPKLITFIGFDPFHSYESETFIAHLT